VKGCLFVKMGLGIGFLFEFFVVKVGRGDLLQPSESYISPLLNNFYIRFFACVRRTKALYSHTKIKFLTFVKVKKIDFENFKVIFDNVKISGFRKFLSTFIRPLFSYNLKKTA
jgi:hypothetical protein